MENVAEGGARIQNENRTRTGVASKYESKLGHGANPRACGTPRVFARQAGRLHSPHKGLQASISRRGSAAVEAS